MVWVDHFRQNARRRISIDGSAGIDVPAAIVVDASIGHAWSGGTR